MAAEAFSLDFPELIIPPAASYAQTLRLQGIEQYDVVQRLLRLDRVVKWIYLAALGPEALGCVPPERITSELLASELTDILPPQPDRGLVACMNKAVRILRGEMEPGPHWNPQEVL